MDIKKIRQAVLNNRGGHEGSTDEAILAIWKSLDESTQKQYFESVKQEPKQKGT